MKKQDLLYIPFYIILSILFLFCIEYLYLDEYETFNSSFYERPFDICRTITNHTYKDIYYGGLTNYLGWLGMAFLIGLACFAFSFPGTYFIDKYLLKGYFFKYLENENSNQIKATFDMIKSCINKVLVGEDEVHEFKDYSNSEVDAFIDSLTSQNFQDVQKFFDTMPRLEHTVEYKIGKRTKTRTFSGLADFFT